MTREYRVRRVCGRKVRVYKARRMPPHINLRTDKGCKGGRWLGGHSGGSSNEQ